MIAIKDIDKFINSFCAKQGWFDGKNCDIRYEMHASYPKDKLTYAITVRPYTEVEEYEIDLVVEGE